VGELIVVVAQSATKPSILSLDPADNFHVDKVRVRSETAANFMNTEESELAGGDSNFLRHLSISFVLRLSVKDLGFWKFCKKSRPFVKTTRRKRRSPIQVPQTQSAFHPAHSETFSVAAMRVSNPDCSSLRFNG
jgi:hypothetical protein